AEPRAAHRAPPARRLARSSVFFQRWPYVPPSIRTLSNTRSRRTRMRLSTFVIDFQYESGASVVPACIMVSQKSAAPFLAGPRLKDRVTRLSHGRNTQGRERG